MDSIGKIEANDIGSNKLVFSNLFNTAKFGQDILRYYQNPGKKATKIYFIFHGLILPAKSFLCFTL